MKKTTIVILLTLALCVSPLPASAYQLSGTISGAVFLGGITYVISLSLSSGTPPDMYLAFVLFGNGSYTIRDVPQGQYIIVAFQDRDNNLTPSTGDYFGWYGQQLPEILNVNGNMSGLNIRVNPMPSTQIEGVISYAGTQTGITLIEAAADTQFTQNQFYSIVLDSTGNGAYTLFLDPGIYYVRAFLDADLNLTYSPGDPSGYYGQPGPHSTVNVTSGPAQGINFAIYDPVAGLSLTLTPTVVPVVIPAQGGSFAFTVRLTNHGNTPEAVDAWLDVVLPNGNPYGPLLNRALMVPGGAQITRILTQAVPAAGPPGQYTYRGFIGDYPNIIAAADSFRFTKTADDGAGAPAHSWNITGWDDNMPSASLPEYCALHPASPNPFNQKTDIRYQLPAASQVKLAVYDITGREVAVLAEGVYSAGMHNVEWEGKDCASGIYFVLLTTRDIVKTRKLLLIK